MRFESYIGKISIVCSALLCMSAGVHQFNMQAQENNLQRSEIQKLQEENDQLKLDIEEYNTTITGLKSENQELRDTITRQQEESSRSYSRTETFTVTAYDLSVDSCGKVPSDPGYGVTASGVNLAGHSLESARAVAVDPSVIPLGSQVRIKFEDDWSHLNGVYTAVDTGGAIIGNRIDLFMGEDAHTEVYDFGVRKAQVEVL